MMAQAIHRLKGTVRWFDGSRGFGFITPEDGGKDLFVHHSSIKAAGFRCLVEGEFVEFSVDVGDDGRSRASGVTGPGGASVQCASYGSGGQRGPTCYSCGEMGHFPRECPYTRSGVTGPGGTSMQCASYGSDGQRGPCYSCGEVGHLASNCCLRNGSRGGVRPCYSCGEMGHFSRECPTTRSGVTGPGGASVQCASYGSGGQSGPCYSCGEVGHLASNCFLRNGSRGGVRPCYSCGEMGHFSRECPYTRSLFHSPSPMPETLTDEEDEVEEDEFEEDDFEEDQVEEDEFEEDVEKFLSGEQRNWAELPRDVLSVIFKKIAAIEIISSAQYVCRPWRHLSKEPELWRYIYISGHSDLYHEIDTDTLAMEAVKRSSGRLEEFHGEYVGNDELMDFMADRATLLRCLRLTAADELNDEGLVQALKKFPLLEELELTLCSFSDEVVELVGQACPHLKTFRLNKKPYIFQDVFESDSELSHDSEALSIAKHMQQLRYLQLFGNMLTNDGLTAILDNCPYLEHLDIRRCLYVNPDENLKKKLARIKVLRLPDDSIADCSFEFSDSEYDFEYGDHGYIDFDEYSDMVYDDFVGDGDGFW